MRKTTIQASVAKKIMKANKDVGKKTKEVPPLIVSTAELFIQEMVQKLTSESNSNEIQLDDIVKLIQSNQQYDFLISSIPDIQACATEEKKKGKPQAEE